MIGSVDRRGREFKLRCATHVLQAAEMGAIVLRIGQLGSIDRAEEAEITMRAAVWQDKLTQAELDEILTP